MSHTLVEWLGGDEDALLDDLQEVLYLCVHGGSSVNFVLPFELADARRFWVERAMPGVRAGSTRLITAVVDDKAVGTALLEFAPQPNQPHRASVGKVLVHPQFRRQGIATAIMTEVERLALANGKWLLSLDTHSESDAERMYRRLGYVALGTIPDFSLHPSNGEYEPATFFYKKLI